MATRTPWGPSQHSEKIARGIVRYDTASHGGIHLSKGRMDNLIPAIKEIKTWAGKGWYEEDCDWALVVLAYPNEFDDLQCYYALGTATRQASFDRPYWPCLDVASYLRTVNGSELQAKAERYKATQETKHEI